MSPLSEDVSKEIDKIASQLKMKVAIVEKYPTPAIRDFVDFLRDIFRERTHVDPLTAPYVIKAFELFVTGNYTEVSLKNELDKRNPVTC